MRKPIKIDSMKTFSVRMDLTPLVKKTDDGYACLKCGLILVRIELGGVLGNDLNELDTTVILDHHLAKHLE